MATIRLLKGDCLQKLKELEDNSVDSIVTDPPYGLGFMGKDWDTFDKSQFGIQGEEGENDLKNKKNFKILPRYNTDGLYQFSKDWAIECYRVLKPGGHLLSFAGSRTYHKICMGVEDAGFEIRDQIMWIYGSGFPKSHNVGNSIDKLYGAGNRGHAISSGNRFHPTTGEPRPNGEKLDKYEARTQQGKGWEGWGTALKPAHEPIVMARKPLSEKTVTENIIKWGTGGINVDGCRIGYVSDYDKKHQEDIRKGTGTFFGGNGDSKCEQVDMQGRFPANIIFDEEAGKILDEQSGITKGSGKPNITKAGLGGGILGQYDGRKTMPTAKDIEMVRSIGDSGGASRFFYCPKASKKDRNEGMEHIQPTSNGKIGTTFAGNQTTSKIGANPNKPTEPRANIHPTVKPTDLMTYLVRLVTPKGGVVLDPFMGSGSTGKACVREGMNFIGIEREDEYMKIAKTRIEHEQKKNKHTLFFDI